MPKSIIAQRLKDAMGLHTPTVGMITITSAIEKRQRALEIESCELYLHSLDNDPHEMQNLIEAVIIPETWFFRDISTYEKLLQYINKKSIATRPDASSPLRILSIPCSSGEEPYSIAMMLADNGFIADEYKIDAVDISKNLILRAQNGIYGRNSFRADDLSFVARHFSEDDAEFTLSDNIKSYVNFHNANLLDPGFLHGHEVYDIILCRNLLIYFDDATQSQVFSVLNRLLKDDGILILGHAETSKKSAGLFETANEIGPYINRKPTSKHDAQVNINHDTTKLSRVATRRPGPSRLINTANKTEYAHPLIETNDDGLEKAFTLANEGNINASIKMARAHIEQDRFSSRAHYLLGLLYDTDGDSNLADEYLKKALYLNPNNIEALIHLSLMAEQRGDIEDSERLRNRAERVQSKSRNP